MGDSLKPISQTMLASRLTGDAGAGWQVPDRQAGGRATNGMMGPHMVCFGLGEGVQIYPETVQEM